MKPRILTLLLSLVSLLGAAEPKRPADGRFLYVAVPGIRNYLEYGGHGVLVFDIDRGHTFVRRVPAAGRNAEGKPLNVKGVVSRAATGRSMVAACRSWFSRRFSWRRKRDSELLEEEG